MGTDSDADEIRLWLTEACHYSETRPTMPEVSNELAGRVPESFICRCSQEAKTSSARNHMSSRHIQMVPTNVRLPALGVVSRSDEKSSDNDMSNLISSNKTPSTHRKLASWQCGIGSPSYRDQHRRASGCSVSQASGSGVTVAGGEEYDN